MPRQRLGCNTDRVAGRRSSLALSVAVLGWAAFGSWVLWTGAVFEYEALDHTVAFFFFSISLLALASQLLGPRRGLPLAIVALVGIALASEYLQSRFTSRPAETADVVSDVIGVALAAALVGLVGVIFRGRQRLWEFMGAICLSVLAASLVLAAASTGPIADRFGCWGRHLDPIASVTGEPILHVDRQLVQIGAEEERMLEGVEIAPNSASLRCSVLRSGSYSIVATVIPSSIESTGPTRIFTSSAGTALSDFNTHIGQEHGELSIRIRSGDDQEQWELVPAVFAEAERVTVAVVIGSGMVTAYVDGEVRARFELAGDGFVDWDDNFPILIGDELSADRTFEGTIESVSFFDRALEEGEPALAVSASTPSED